MLHQHRGPNCEKACKATNDWLDSPPALSEQAAASHIITANLIRIVDAFTDHRPQFIS